MNVYLVEARLPPVTVARARREGGDVLGAPLAAAVKACGGTIDLLLFRGSDLGLLAVVLLPASPAAVELLVLLAADDAIASPKLSRLTPVSHGTTGSDAAPVFLIRAEPRPGRKTDPYGLVGEAVAAGRGRLIGLYRVGSGGELLALARLPEAAAVAAQLRASPVFSAFSLGRALTLDDVALALMAVGEGRTIAAPPAPPGSGSAPPSA